jgi:hypothetical protein
MFDIEPDDDVHAECAHEIKRLTAVIKKANEQAEYYEREWYLREYEIEKLQNEIAAVFVYEHKNTGEIRVRWLYDAQILNEDENWIHIGTLEPRSYIGNLLREYPALVRKMKCP